MAGNDLRNMTPETRDILTNREVIAVNQDPLGIQGRKVRDDGDLEVWTKKLSGAYAVVLFNRSSSDATMAVSWQEIGLPHDAEMVVRDLWAKKDWKQQSPFVARVPPHDVVMIRVEPVAEKR